MCVPARPRGSRRWGPRVSSIFAWVLAAATSLEVGCVPVDPGALPVDPLLVDADSDGFTPAQGDCDDTDADRSPDVAEACNGADDDCDQATDEAFDTDGDGYSSCDGVAGFLDCDDTDAAKYPGKSEICDGKDNNCNGATDEGIDLDDDGYGGCGEDAEDCDDENEDVYPDASPLCDGLDNDCDQDVDEGYDNDGDGVPTCALDGQNPDCDDSQITVYPGRAEICDALDNNCDGHIDEGFDDDRDGYPSCRSATPEGESITKDCDDTNPDVSPGEPEVCNTLDDDCDRLIDQDDPGVVGVPTWHPDEDRDTYGDMEQSVVSCAPPSGAVQDGTDCDDSDPRVNPTTVWYPDLDGDGWGTGETGTPGCERPIGAYAPQTGDCDDEDELRHPDATERCDAIDQDCDGQADDGILGVDSDRDGHVACAAGGQVLDCDDADATAYPGATEVCDGADDDCDGTRDDGFDRDNDGVSTCVQVSTPIDCDDTSAAIKPGATEVCDGVDTNCSGGGGDLYVASGGDKQTIQAGIDAAGAGCVVVVAEGTWAERIDFKGKAITVRSEKGASKTVIDGDKGFADPGVTVSFINGERETSILRGFTVTGDNGYTPDQSEAIYGGALYLGAGTAPKILDNLVRDNTADVGAAVYCNACDGALLAGNTFSFNTAYRAPSVTNTLIFGEGGAVFVEDGDVFSRDNTYLNNVAGRLGGAVYVSGGSFVSQGDSFSGNSAIHGGAIAAYTGAMTLLDATFVQNVAQGITDTLRSVELLNGRGGAVLAEGVDVVLERARVEDNTAAGATAGVGSGGGVRVYDGSLDALHVVFVANTASTGGGGLYVDVGDFEVRNCLFADNAGTIGGGLLVEKSASLGLYNNTFVDNVTSVGTGTLYVAATNGPMIGNLVTFEGTAWGYWYDAESVYGDVITHNAATISYNDLFGNTAGQVGGDAGTVVGARGNVSVDPLFVDRASGDYHLAVGSPARDASDPGASYQDPDGSRGDLGMFGGPEGDWDPDGVGAEGAP